MGTDDWATQWLYSERGYGTDVLQYPVIADTIERTLEKRYIRTNISTQSNMIVLDVDDDDADRKIKSLAWDDEVLPEPNWITINPNTGHGHVGYWLAAPVCTSFQGNEAPKRFLSDVTGLLEVATGADTAYTGYLTRNPFFSEHHTEFLTPDPYSLGDLRATLGEHFTTKIAKPSKRLEALRESGSRHQGLFVDMATWCYANHRYYTDEAAFARAAEVQADIFAIEYIANPLPVSEVRSIVRSIVAWTWRNMHTEKAQRQFRARQAARGRRNRKFTIDMITEAQA